MASFFWLSIYHLLSGGWQEERSQLKKRQEKKKAHSCRKKAKICCGRVQPTDQSFQLQAYLRDTEGSVLDHHNKASYNLFAGGGYCLQFVRNATSERAIKQSPMKRGEPIVHCDDGRVNPEREQGFN